MVKDKIRYWKFEQRLMAECKHDAMQEILKGLINDIHIKDGNIKLDYNVESYLSFIETEAIYHEIKLNRFVVVIRGILLCIGRITNVRI